MKKYSLVLIVIISAWLNALSQGADSDFERIKVGDAKQILCGLALSPDNKEIAVSSIQSFPFYLYNWKDQKVESQFDVGNWYAGSSVRYSQDGKYILLQQLYYIDWAPNKDREVNYELLDAKTGQRLKRFDEYHAMAFSPDSKYVLSLTANEVAFWGISSGKKEKSFIVPNATNGLAISPDGQFIAVAHKVNEAGLKKDPRFKKNKKGLKHAVKYKQQISIYDAHTFDYKYTVNELYDIVYKLEYTPDGKIMFCLQIPHMKAQALEGKRQTYLTTIDAVKGEPMRRGFTSQALYEPDFKLSEDGSLLGIVSQGSRFLELHIYDFATGKMIDRFEQSYRLFEKTDAGMTVADSRMSFVFLPGNETVVMTMGNHLIYWNFKPLN
ncbi:MAG: WD40 repeat domain-containing protein [Bacteroidales bacterium]|nr:WD40 repeat domain-containing protein [Bacteroidales bacterium]MCF8405464.1 WD40 repeat domain-containing protein [Bacteroidales bacterium]